MTVEERGRGTLALLGDRRFAPYFYGRLSSHLAIWVQNIASTILVYRLSRSATMVGAVSVLQFLPQILLMPWAGALSDRLDRRKLLMLGRAPAAMALLALGIAILLRGADDPTGTWLILATSLVGGIGWAVSAPAGYALVPALVPERDLDVAVTLHTITGNVARAVGPALAGVLLVTAGAGAAFLAAGAAHCVFIVLLWFIRPLRPRTGGASGNGGIMEGLRHVRADVTLRTLLLGGAAVGIATDPVMTLTPALASKLGGGDPLVSAMASAFGIGAVTMILALGWLRARFGLRRVAAGGLVVAGLAMLAAGSIQSIPAVLAFLFVAGSGSMSATSALASELQRRVPEGFRGRVMALWGVAFLGSRPLAASLNGMLADLVSVQAALATTAAIACAASVLTLSADRRSKPSAGSAA